MARKPANKSRRSPAATPVGSATRGAAAARKQLSPVHPSGDIEALRRELAAALTRIAELERNRQDVLRRIDAAIAMIHTLLES